MTLVGVTSFKDNGILDIGKRNLDSKQGDDLYFVIDFK